MDAYARRVTVRSKSFAYFSHSRLQFRPSHPPTCPSHQQPTPKALVSSSIAILGLDKMAGCCGQYIALSTCLRSLTRLGWVLHRVVTNCWAARVSLHWRLRLGQASCVYVCVFRRMPSALRHPHLCRALSTHPHPTLGPASSLSLGTGPLPRCLATISAPTLLPASGGPVRLRALEDRIPRQTNICWLRSLFFFFFLASAWWYLIGFFFIVDAVHKHANPPLVGMDCFSVYLHVVSPVRTNR